MDIPVIILLFHMRRFYWRFIQVANIIYNLLVILYNEMFNQYQWKTQLHNKKIDESCYSTLRGKKCRFKYKFNRNTTLKNTLLYILLTGKYINKFLLLKTYMSYFYHGSKYLNEFLLEVNNCWIFFLFFIRFFFLHIALSFF
jgi:hypothetical protein